MTTPALVRAMLDPAVYPHPVDSVELVETHISWVFLAGDRVWKVKKPVDLGFLDFTSRERRRFFCQEEVRLNRRLAPDVYLGVVDIGGTPDRPRLGGPGQPVPAAFETAVLMRRLPAERMLDRLVQEGRASPALLGEVAAVVAAFHAAAATGGEIDAFAGVEAVGRNWQENFAQTAGFPAALLEPAWREAVGEAVQRFLAAEAGRFAARAAGGRSRDCHGDLQAQHVCCTEPIRIFDCIEFNARFRFGDTAGEVAFLAMDLERLGRADLGVHFLNAYLEESDDWDAVPLLDFYRAYRAWVRGKVLGFQAGTRPERAAEARACFALAARYLAPRPRPRLLAVSGVMGSGKSTLARTVAARLGALVIRTDAVRKRLAGRGLRDRAPDAFGQGLYTPEMTARTYAASLELAGRLLDAGWTVVLDGSFSRAAERRPARALAAGRGLEWALLWCEAPDALIVERLRARAGEGREISDGRPELLAAHRAAFEPPAGEPGVVRVDTGAEPEAAATRTLAALGPRP